MRFWLYMLWCCLSGYLLGASSEFSWLLLFGAAVTNGFLGYYLTDWGYI